jgi:hypothetical protein
MRKLLFAAAIALCGLAMATRAQCETLKDIARDGRLTVPRIVVIWMNSDGDCRYKIDAKKMGAFLAGLGKPVNILGDKAIYNDAVDFYNNTVRPTLGADHCTEIWNNFGPQGNMTAGIVSVRCPKTP